MTSQAPSKPHTLQMRKLRFSNGTVSSPQSHNKTIGIAGVRTCVSDF